MDNPDKDFESFLGQFRLRRQRPFPEETPAVELSRGYRWVFAAAVVVAALLSIPFVRNFSRRGTPSATVEVAGDSLYKAGERISNGSPVRSGGSESAVVRLEDGTELELRAQSEVLLESAASKDVDIRVRLNSGSVLVTAAKQRNGHLYVETKDIVLSVVGTVFLVEAEPSGTSVGVIEGVVEVQAGTAVRKLSPGEQLSTEPLKESRRLADSFAWSRSARRLAALLPSPPVIALGARPAPAMSPVTRRAALGAQPQQETPQPSQPPQQAPPAAPPEQQQQSDAGANGTGKEIFGRACGLCHALNIMDTGRYANREAYAALVSKQVSMGAPVSERDIPVLIDYLFLTYGTKPRP